MKLLFMTTSPNQVYDYLKNLNFIQMKVVDFKDFNKTKNIEIETLILGFEPDMILTYRCPYILSKEWYSLASLGAYNIHPSLLPKYAGLNPWKSIFDNHERENGVTLHRISRIIDGGEIIFQKSYVIEDTDTLKEARDKADLISVELIGKLLGMCGEFNRIKKNVL